MTSRVFKTKLLFCLWLCLSNPVKASDPDTAKHLKLISTHPLQIPEPSGLALDTGGCHLWTVSDRTNRVYKIDLSGATLDTLLYVGEDLEGVAHNSTDGTLWVVEERQREIVQLDTLGNEILRRQIPVKQKRANKGLEGITFNSRTRTLFVVNQKSPKLLLEIDTDLTLRNKYKLTFAKDYSAIAYDERADLLWILSDASQALWQCDLIGHEIEKYIVDVRKSEGLAINAEKKLLYLVSDSDSELSIFKLPE